MREASASASILYGAGQRAQASVMRLPTLVALAKRNSI
jgi:hypothetical protein